MTPTPGEFLDTNVLVYSFGADPRAAKAEQLLNRGCAISLQGLNEFANVARRKLGMSWAEVNDALASIRVLCPVILPLDLDTHAAGIGLGERYRLSVFDGLMVAAALRGGCTTLWSEDMQDGLVVDNRLRIVNPFRAS